MLRSINCGLVVRLRRRLFAGGKNGSSDMLEILTDGMVGSGHCGSHVAPETAMIEQPQHPEPTPKRDPPPFPRPPDPIDEPPPDIKPVPPPDIPPPAVPPVLTSLNAAWAARVQRTRP
jgi:hypothetical protein